MASSKKKRQKIRPLRTVAYYATWLVPWRTFIRVRALRSGLTFRSHRRGVITRYIAKYGEHEPELTGWLSRYLSTCRRGLFVDVGANIGWHALHAATLAGVDTVVAFEADPVNAWLLECNRTDNNIANVVIKAAAVGDRRGTAQLHRYKDSNTARHSLATDHGMGSITVPLIDLDGALDELGLSDRPIAALKVDVEGFEPAVIAGAQRALARTQAVVIELSPLLYREAGLSIDNLLRTLHTNGFTPFTVQPDGSLQADVTEWTDQNVVCELVWLRGTPAHGAQSRTA